MPPPAPLCCPHPAFASPAPALACRLAFSTLKTLRAPPASRTRAEARASGLAPCSHLSVPNAPARRALELSKRSAGCVGRESNPGQLLEGSYAHHYTTNAPQPAAATRRPRLAPAYSRRRRLRILPDARQPEALRRRRRPQQPRGAPARQRYAVAGIHRPTAQGGAPRLAPSGPSLPRGRQRLRPHPGGQRGARSFQHQLAKALLHRALGEATSHDDKGTRDPPACTRRGAVTSRAAWPSRAYEPLRQPLGVGAWASGGPPDPAMSGKAWVAKEASPAVATVRPPTTKGSDGGRGRRPSGPGGRTDSDRGHQKGVLPPRRESNPVSRVTGGDTHHYTNEDGGDRLPPRRLGSRAACPRLPLPSTGAGHTGPDPTAHQTNRLGHSGSRHPDRDPDPRGTGPSPARAASCLQRGVPAGEGGARRQAGLRGHGGRAPAGVGPGEARARRGRPPRPGGPRRQLPRSRRLGRPPRAGSVDPTPDGRLPACLPACWRGARAPAKGAGARAASGPSQASGHAPSQAAVRMAERSKALRSGRSLPGGVGSNPLLTSQPFGPRTNAPVLPAPLPFSTHALPRTCTPTPGTSVLLSASFLASGLHLQLLLFLPPCLPLPTHAHPRPPPPSTATAPRARPAPGRAEARSPRRVASPPRFAGAPTSAGERPTRLAASLPRPPRQLSRQAGTPSSAPARRRRLRSQPQRGGRAPALPPGGAACPRPFSASVPARVLRWEGAEALRARQPTPGARPAPPTSAPRRPFPWEAAAPAGAKPALARSLPLSGSPRARGRSAKGPLLTTTSPSEPDPGARSARAQEPGSHAFGPWPERGSKDGMRAAGGRRSEASTLPRSRFPHRPSPRPFPGRSRTPHPARPESQPPGGLWVGTRRSLRGTMARGRSDHAAPAPDRDPGALTRHREGRGGRGRRRRRGTGRVGPRPVARAPSESAAPGVLHVPDPVLQVAARRLLLQRGREMPTGEQ
ncbi:PREDICTED: collagen alpha-1(I) chain-like [Capra hircus]|uniref:collagen alpha-1(I) chain-like n=1 Tax=Capra hircus TaxID=9925 RepID=UPI0008478EB4|nr:PREDICTED: collagen alpha-1(I) chain-like [Capra hircus]